MNEKDIDSNLYIKIKSRRKRWGIANEAPIIGLTMKWYQAII